MSRAELAKNGFSLIELMISLFVLSIATGALIAYSSHQAQADRYVRALSSHNDLIAEIKMTLNSETVCTANYGGLELPMDPAEQVKAAVRSYDGSGTVTDTIAKAGEAYDENIDVTGVFISRKATMPNDYVLFKLTIFTDKTGNILGPRSNTAEIPLMAVVDASQRIIRCYGNFQSDGQHDVEQSICRLTSDGTMSYDPTKNKCVDALSCYPGTAYEAKCPAGQIAKKCSASGYTLTAAEPEVERTYQDGSTRMKGPPDYIWKIENQNTCKCTYANEVTVTSTTQCSACCVDDPAF